MPESFFIETYGCQMNVYDSQRIADAMVDSGFKRVLVSSEAAVVILYTCHVRENAMRKVFSNIQMMKTRDTKVVAIGGCVAQSLGETVFKKCSAVNIVFGPHVGHRLPGYVRSILNEDKSKILDVGQVGLSKFDCLPKKKEVTFSEFVTIQEGCDNFCTYCVVPYTRGRERSRPASDILAEVRHLVSNGAAEITLLGQNVNSYAGDAPYINIGQPKGVWTLERLIREISEISGLRRLRYTTSHPRDLTTNLMKAHAEIDVLVPFLHLPAQSGSDRILKGMKRGYTANEYIDKLEKFRDICANIQFSTDIIVGFPTETESDFEDTIRLVERAKYVTAFLFKYSRREGTVAAAMDGQISKEDKAHRLAVLQKILATVQMEHKKCLIGQKQEVLFEKAGKKVGQCIGKNVYMQSIVVDSRESLIGTFADVRINSIAPNCLFGSVTCPDP
jgi:tRNA-2-methylthio-N6-dimethylallyladenosine synthase